MAELFPTEDYADGSVARIVSSGIFHSTAAAEDDAALAKEDGNWLDLGEDTEEGIQSAFQSMLDEAAQNGLSISGNTKLCAMLQEYRDVFRLRLRNDPPAEVEPIKVVLKADATSIIAKTRRYRAPQRAFIETYTGKLEEYGFIKLNHSAAWAAALLLVPKPPTANYRPTFDYRPVNKVTGTTLWPMPHVESELSGVRGSTVFAKIEFCSGYWQLLLGEEGQGALSFMTPKGVQKPLRTTQGGNNCEPNFSHDWNLASLR